MKELIIYHKRLGLLSYQIDDEDYEWISDRSWFIKSDKQPYIKTNRLKKDPMELPKKLYLHKLLMFKHFNRYDVEVDHKDGNIFNNQKNNLRYCNTSENVRNSTKSSNLSSKYKGVSWSKAGNKWQVFVKANNKVYFVGLFSNEMDAALAYDQMARFLFGEFARLNFPDRNVEIISVNKILNRKKNKHLRRYDTDIPL